MLERPRVAAVLLGLMMVFQAASQPGWAETEEDSDPSQDLTAQSGDRDMTYDWKEREWTMPLAFQAGRVDPDRQIQIQPLRRTGVDRGTPG
jgi:hypothetical protein